MRRFIVKIQNWIDDTLRKLCGRITPEKRLGVILVMFIIFGVASLYIFVSAIYQIGRDDGQRIKIEHINGLQLHYPKDSINQLNFNNNGRED